MTRNQNRLDPKYLLLLILLLLWLLPFAGTLFAQGEDLGIITSPTDHETVSGLVEIRGSADHPSFEFYKIEYALEPVGDQWPLIGDTLHNEPVLDGLLATWDTTGLPDGSYTLRLRVVRTDANYTEAFAQHVVVSNSQPPPTLTPLPAPPPNEATLTAATPAEIGSPTATRTPLPPTPTILVDQPVVDTPTPRPSAAPTEPPLQDPEASDSLVPEVKGFSFAPLQAACLYGAGAMLSVFVLFGFLAALRVFIQGFMDRWQG
jgi:hypothetical protein